MKGYVTDIEADTLENTNFRTVVYTAQYMQLVLMSVPVGGEIGEEKHGQDQFIRIEQGEGKAVLDDVEHTIADGSAIVVPAGTKHNFINTGDEDMKLYTLYATPHHTDGIVHKTKADAEKDEETGKDEFLGDTTE
ncbi:MAG: cupin domain-containing protein [Candidatus Paceibacterota bacterium]